MKAYHIYTSGEAPQLVNLPKGDPAEGEIRLRITACGLNFADLLMIKGKYQDTPQAPFTLGMEVAGIVDAHGPGVSEPAIGTRVALFAGQGGLAEYGCFPAERAIPLPDNMSEVDAAGFQIAYGTSHLALDYKARLQPNETLLVLGAAGGVGLTAVEIGKVMGAKVIACARGPEKLEIAKAYGADHVIDATKEDIRDVVKSLGGADVVYDPVGGEQFTAAFRATNPDGRLLAIGFASGDVPPIPANHMLVKNLTVIGMYWGGYLKFNAKALTDSMAQLFAWYSEGKIKPHVSETFPLDQVADGLEMLKSRKSTGKVVITI